MSAAWQDVAALVIVALAAGYLWWHLRRAAGGGACHDCRRCTAKPNTELLTIAPLAPAEPRKPTGVAGEPTPVA